MNTYNKTYTNSQLWQRFLPYFSKYKWWVLLDLFCAGLTTINELVLPMILRFLTNTGLNNAANLTGDLIFNIALLYIVLKIIDVIAYAFMQNTGHIIGAKIETDMRMDIYSHLQTMSASFYSNTNIGKLMARITNDLFDVTEFAHHCPEEFFMAGIKFLVSFVLLVRIDVPLTLAIFILIPIMFFAMSSVNKRFRQAQYDQRSHIGVLNSSIEDTLLGIDVVRSFTNEEYEIERFKEDNDTFLNIKRNMYLNMSKFHAISRAFDGLMYVLVIGLGGYFMMLGRILPGDLVAYVLYVNLLTATIRRIVDFTEQFHKGMTGIEKFVEIMDIKPDIVDKEDPYILEDSKGHIVFDSVDFSYNEEDDCVLEDFNLEVRPGTKLALVGPSGGGKSTIIKLIPRFYDVDDGSICIDGHNIKDISLDSLRDQIGIVQQNVYLFADTIFENIRYGRPDATDEEIKQAAVLAGVDEFIRDLPQGYNTFVGERGLRLSGGQQQRISIARVFLKNPPILILDEATSALDNESEAYVQESLEKLSKGRTTITIAHRLSTIMDSDEIVVITKDGIQESGSHKELIDQKGIYYSFYTMGIQSFDDSF